ncbi:hypothetical protein HZH66_006964 [Vespula vulgaris]|uniref:Uncharacterized protein n=1 Tax=Vespula vulgaris TaxID=7454 RepID=A0A834K2T3_VESVU|nr:hypothetical protein HZH66_006964 [Vespula vulgaris]
MNTYRKIKDTAQIEDYERVRLQKGVGPGQSGVHLKKGSFRAARVILEKCNRSVSIPFPKAEYTKLENVAINVETNKSAMSRHDEEPSNKSQIYDFPTANSCDIRTKLKAVSKKRNSEGKTVRVKRCSERTPANKRIGGARIETSPKPVMEKTHRRIHAFACKNVSRDPQKKKRITTGTNGYPRVINSKR